jgi:hypothetical protein
MEQPPKNQSNLDDGLVRDVTQGKIPSNEQLLHAMNSTKHALQEQMDGNPQLDEKGRRIISAAEALVDSTGGMIAEKNSDEAIQRFALHAVEIAQRIKMEGDLKGGKVKEALHRISDFAPNIRRMISDLSISTEFREFIIEIISISEEIFTQLKQKIAEGEQPVEEIKELPEISEDEKRRLSEKLTSLFVKIGQNPSFKTWRQQFFHLFDYFRDSRIDPAINPEFRSDLSKLYNEGVELLQRFLPEGEKFDLKRLQQRFWELYDQLYQNSEIQRLFYDLRDWSDQLVETPELAKKEEITSQGIDLVGNCVNLVRNQFGDQIKSVITDAKDVLLKFGDDVWSKRMKESWQNIRHAVSGSLIQTLSQLRHLVLPLFQTIDTRLPLPSIHQTTETFNYSLDKIVLRSKHIQLDDVTLHITMGLKELLRLSIHVKNFGVTVDSMHFSYERTAPPKWCDQGICSADLKASDIFLEWAVLATGSQPPKFKLDRVVVDISKFDLDVKDAGHKFIDQMIIGLFSEDLCLNAQKAVEEALRHHASFLTKGFDDFFIDQMLYLSPPPFPTTFSQEDSSSPKADSSEQESFQEPSSSSQKADSSQQESFQEPSSSSPKADSSEQESFQEPSSSSQKADSSQQESSQEASNPPFSLKEYSTPAGSDSQQAAHEPDTMLPATHPKHVDWDLYRKDDQTTGPGLPDGPQLESSHSGMPEQAKRHIQACELTSLPSTFSA